MKSFKNASELIGQYHEKNKPCANIGDKGKAAENENVPSMMKKVVSPMFKACEVNFSEEELIIKQEIADEDNEKKNTETTSTSKDEKKPMVNQDSKTPVKEVKTVDDKGKAKKTERMLQPF